MKSVRSRINVVPLAFCIGVPAIFFLALALAMPRLPDEQYIVGPALAQFGVMDYTGYVVYPPFLHIFYGFFLKIASLFTPVGMALAQRLCRVINVILFLASALIFFRMARRYMGERSALLSVLFFCFSPAVVFGGMVLKSESLAIFIVLLGMDSCLAIAEKRAGRGAHALAGLLTGLLVMTKYNPCLALPYGLALLLAHSQAEPGKQEAGPALASALKDRGLPLYLALACASVLAALALGIKPSPRDASAILNLGEYFSPFPSALRSTDRPLDLLYGRYSYPLFILMPAFMGIACYLLGWLGIVFRTIPRVLFYCLGGFSLSYFLFFTAVTLSRQTQNFSILVPFFALGAAGFVRLAWRSFSKPRLAAARKAALALVVACVLYQSLYFPALCYGLLLTNSAISRTVSHREDILYLTCTESTAFTDIYQRDLKHSVLKKRPAYIFVMERYMANFCKYPDDPDYMEQCNFLMELRSGKTPYRLLWEKLSWYPFMSLFSLDPGLSSNYYMFIRVDGGAGPVHG